MIGLVNKTFVSYVIQNEKGHKHESAIVTTQSPPYSYSANPQVSDVMEWADEKRKRLKKEEELIVVSMYNTLNTIFKSIKFIQHGDESNISK